MLYIDSCSPVAWQLTLSRPKSQKEAGENKGNSIEMDADDGDLTVLIFHSLITSDKTVSANFKFSYELWILFYFYVCQSTYSRKKFEIATSHNFYANYYRKLNS